MVGDRSGTSSRVVIHPIDVRYLLRRDKIVKKASAFRNATQIVSNRAFYHVLQLYGRKIYPKINASEDYTI